MNDTKIVNGEPVPKSETDKAHQESLATAEQDREVRRMRDEVNAERNRRHTGGFFFRGVPFDNHDSAKEDIRCALTAAEAAKRAGMPRGHLTWNPLQRDEEVHWQTALNEPYPMDPYDFIEFKQAMEAHQIATTQRAILIKRINEARIQNPVLGPLLDPREDWVWTEDLNEGD